MKGSEQAHHCPFCHHHKKKLQVNLETQQWHCWVCDSKGKRITSLLRKLHVDSKKLQKLYEIYGDDYVVYSNESQEETIELRLPSEFKSLLHEPKGLNPTYKKAKHYADSRGITTEDIIRYNIGYVDSGIYSGRIIIPSYDVNNKLNYFIARSVFEEEKFKYKNPPVNRDVIVFENQINWNEPITLVEGVFDAFSVKRNVIPLLGKFLLSKLKNKIFEKGVKEVNIILDSDAITDSTKHTDWFIKNGIKVKNIIPSDKDAGELGYEKVNELIKTTNETGWDENVLAKLNNLC
jgi:DNA primase